ncbi:MAG TPA: Calx-beta domain-containing protein [Micromonosporaceae bacterium]|jgi:hypothetical protein|nr:Calx-beta domain-containing protein [Micromonosporaceae bacterium]
MLKKLRRLAVLITAAAALPLAVPGPSAQAVFPPCPRYLSIADYRANEGPDVSGAAAIFTFTITSTGCGYPGGVDYSTIEGTATWGDFTPTGGSISFAAGDMSPRTIAVAVSPDSTRERDEDFTVKICHPTSGGIQFTRAVAQGTIINDDVGELKEPGWPHIELKCSENPSTIVR